MLPGLQTQCLVLSLSLHGSGPCVWELSLHVCAPYSLGSLWGPESVPYRSQWLLYQAVPGSCFLRECQHWPVLPFCSIYKSVAPIPTANTQSAFYWCSFALLPIVLTKILSEYDINAHFMGKEMGPVVYWTMGANIRQPDSVSGTVWSTLDALPHLVLRRNLWNSEIMISRFHMMNWNTETPSKVPQITKRWKGWAGI